MALKEIAVDGCILNHKTGSLISGGTFTISSIPSTKVKCMEKGVFETPLQFTFSGGNAPTCDPGTVATISPQNINSMAQKVKADSKLVMLKEDFTIMSAMGTLAGNPVPIFGAVEISDAGQTKVLAS